MSPRARAAALCLRERCVTGVLQDGSATGRWVPSIRADKTVPVQGRTDDPCATAAAYRDTPHPYTAVVHARALQRAGRAAEGLDVCRQALRRFAGSPDASGDTNFLSFMIALFAGRPAELCQFKMLSP
jgi:hypothetical protein